ncbi:MAG TPA: MMPL family transporter [Vicinamibacteria bacterium]
MSGSPVLRFQWPILLAWLAAGAALLPLAPGVEDRLEVSARILGSESAETERLLAEGFESPFARSAVLVLSGLPAPDRPEGRAALERVVAGLAARPEVTATFSHLDRADGSLLGQGGEGTFVVVGLQAPGGRVDRLQPDLRQATAAIEVELRSAHPGAALLWTGEAALNHDLWRSSAEATHRAERRTLPLTLALLLFAFGSVTAAMLTAASGALAVGLAMGVVALAAARFPLSILAVNVTSMIGLALGIDYALLTVTRFREARAGGATPAEAAAQAAHHAGRTVALSGLAVAIGFLALLLVPLNELRSAVLGGIAVTFVSVLAASTLLPLALRALGDRLEWGRWRTPRDDGGARWRAWSRRVCARPWTVLLTAGLPLALLALQAARLNPQIPRGDWLPPSIESARGIAALRAMGRSGVVQTLRVVLELPETTTALEREGWEAQRRLERRLLADPRIARVESLPGVAGDRADDLAYVALLPALAKRAFLGSEGERALLEAVPREDADPEDVAGLVREIRQASPVALTGLEGARVRVGGLPAFNADYEDAVGGRMGVVVVLVVATTLAVLLLAFRSLLVPLKAVALNLFAVSGAFGALVLVFQDGHGARLLGLAAPLDGVFPIVPALVFCTVFGLSMDYEVFLVARVAEARRAGLSEDEALAEGLARTGPVITSAAAIMIAVFAAFMLGEFVLLKMLGFALAVAVLLDATVIRMAIGPALLRLAGRWNWWPGR